MLPGPRVTPHAVHVVGAVMAAGTVVTIAGALGAWLRSGARGRSSFEVFEMARRLGFAPEGAFTQVLRWWPVMPLVIVAANVALWWGWERLATALAVVGGGYSVATSFGVLQAPNIGLIHIGWGVRVTLVGGLVVAGSGAALAVVTARLSRISRRTTDLAPPTPDAVSRAGPS